MNERRETTAVLQTNSKNCYAGMHLDVYKLINFVLGVMIDTIELST